VAGAQSIRDLAQRLDLELDDETVAGLQEDFERGWQLLEQRGA
jgi:hypothetical protein